MVHNNNLVGDNELLHLYCTATSSLALALQCFLVLAIASRSTCFFVSLLCCSIHCPVTVIYRTFACTAMFHRSVRESSVFVFSDYVTTFNDFVNFLIV
jgi:hypothetical protein